MPWIPADADAVRAAILKFAIGKRVVSVLFAGPPQRSVTYQMAQLDELRALLAQITRELGGGATYRLGATRTGLDRGPVGGTGNGGFGGCW